MKECADAQYRADHRAERNEQSRAWTALNPEARHAIQARYRDKHAEAIAAARREATASGRYTETYRAWRATPAGQIAMRNHSLRNRYGVGLDWYEETLAAQDGHCRLCSRTPEEEGRALAVDHDHACCPGRKSCGKCLRGLLCTACNNRLPLIETPDERWATAARSYLAEYAA